MFRGVEGQSALYGDDRRPRPLHLCTHGPQELLKVYDLRLLGGPHQSGPARTATGGQQDVLCGPHAGQGEAQLPPPHLLSPPAQEAAPLLPDLRPQLAQRAQMEVDGPWAQFAAPRVGQLHLPHPGQQRPQEDHRGPQLPHQGSGDHRPIQLPRVQRDGVPLPAHPAAQQAQDVQGSGHVGQVRTVVDHALSGGQQGGGQDGQHTVLGPLNSEPPPQGGSAVDLITAHGMASNPYGFRSFYGKKRILVTSSGPGGSSRSSPLRRAPP